MTLKVGDFFTLESNNGEYVEKVKRMVIDTRGDTIYYNIEGDKLEYILNIRDVNIKLLPKDEFPEYYL